MLLCSCHIWQSLCCVLHVTQLAMTFLFLDAKYAVIMMQVDTRLMHSHEAQMLLYSKSDAESLPAGSVQCGMWADCASSQECYVSLSEST